MGNTVRRSERALKLEGVTRVGKASGVSYLAFFHQREEHEQAKGRNEVGLTALHGTAYTGHLDVAALLIKSGADVNGSANRLSMTLLHLGISGNLCRCTCYQNIVKAIRNAAQTMPRRRLRNE